MRMIVRRLINPVKVQGFPIFGPGKAELVMAPHSGWSTLGWDLVTSRRRVAITPKNVLCTAQNIAVVVGDSTLAHSLEHLLPLKVAGFLEMSIKSTHSLPFSGNTEPFLSLALNSAHSEDSEDVMVKTPEDQFTWYYPKLRSGVRAYTSMSPRNDGKLRIYVKVNYPGLGEYEKSYEFPDNALLERIASVHTQGWPRRRYWISKAARSLGLWKHHDQVVWPQDQTREKTLELFADHRCLDLLGALGLLMHGQWFSADVYSVCSGHTADLNVIEKVNSKLISLRI